MIDTMARVRAAATRRSGLATVACIFFFVAFVPLSGAVGAARAPTFPKPSGYVNDFANILDARVRADLESELRSAERQTSAEVVVATVPSLAGMTIEEYANGLFQAWGIGKKGTDNGVLVLVAPSERRVRIEVGYGLEGVLPDGLSGEIIRTDILPAFKRGDYAGGVLAGVRRVNRVVIGNHTLTADERRQLTTGLDTGRTVQPPWFVIVPFFGVFIVVGAFVLGFGLGAGAWFLVLWGAGFSTGDLAILLLMPMPAWALWSLRALGLGMLVLGFRVGRRHPFALKASPWSVGNSGGFRTETSSSSAYSSGSSDSGGSSGGDFGGGSSGGGGASGSW